MTIPETKIEHVWQDFRIRCLDFAIKAGAEGEATIPLAKKFEAYILTKSDTEKSQANTSAEKKASDVT